MPIKNRPRSDLRYSNRLLLLFVFILIFSFSSCYRDLDNALSPISSNLNPPQNVSVLYARDASIYISWNRVSTEISGYRIYQSNSSEFSSFYRVAETDKNYFIAKDLIYEQTYYYKITSYNAFSESSFSDTVSGNPKNLYPPNIPTGLVVYGSNSEDKKQFFLSWYPNQDGDFMSYFVYRAIEVNTNVGEFKKIGQTNKNSYIDSVSITTNQKYHFKISANDKGGLISNLSNPESDYILEKAKITSPSDQVILTGALIFKWEKVLNAKSYVFILSSSRYSNEIWTKEIEDNGSENYQTSVAADYIDLNRTYFWKVAAISKSNNYPNSYSVIRSFYYSLPLQKQH